MSWTVNKVILLGNLGADPEVRTDSLGGRHVSFSLATSWRNKNTGQDEPEWHRIKCSGKLAELAEGWLHKGDKVYVEGRIVPWRTEEGKHGTDIYAREIILTESKAGRPAAEERSPFDDEPGPRAAPKRGR